MGLERNETIVRRGRSDHPKGPIPRSLLNCVQLLLLAFQEVRRSDTKRLRKLPPSLLKFPLFRSKQRGEFGAVSFYGGKFLIYFF